MLGQQHHHRDSFSVGTVFLIIATFLLFLSNFYLFVSINTGLKLNRVTPLKPRPLKESVPSATQTPVPEIKLPTENEIDTSVLKLQSEGSPKRGFSLLKISDGVSVYHNFSAIMTNRSASFANHTVPIITFDSGWMKEHFVFFPPFPWSLPHGLTEKQSKLFWLQPENHWHFEDANMTHISVIWDVKNGQSALSKDSECTNHKHTHHLNFCSPPETVENPSIDGTVFISAGHYLEIFQHFCDNGIPHLSIASIASGVDPKDAHVATAACNGMTIQMIGRMGFDLKNVQRCMNPGNVVSAKRLIMVTSLRVLHPYFYDWYRERMHFAKAEKRDKIVLVPRGRGSGGGAARIIDNLLDIVPILEKRVGKGNVIVYSSNYGGSNSFDATIELFGRAAAVIGPHGGAFYNQFYSPPGIDVVEMIPMMSTGKYPKQTYWDKEIPFAHLAMYSNTQLLGQNFWRYITMDVDINYRIDVSDFEKWSLQVPSLRPNTTS